MTRRKSVCLTWTLVISIVIICPFVNSRPQDASSTSSAKETTTENSIRYRYNNSSLILSPKLPVIISFVQNFDNNTLKYLKQNKIKNFNEQTIVNDTNRTSRLIKSVVIKDMSKNTLNKHGLGSKTSPKPSNIIKLTQMNYDTKPAIRKVLTKWKDETKYEDLTFTYETTTSDEVVPSFVNSNYATPEKYTSTETTKVEPISKKRHPANYFTAVQKPQHEYSEETHVYSTNVQIVDSYPSQSTYMYTKRPSPTPEITNVGYPKPWYQQNPQVYRKPTTLKPVQVTKPLNYDYHNVNNYPSEFEVTTFQPTSAYTDKIVIRPEEYSNSNLDCPTIYLTLNNTFQGQGKEACPDLNIAVNTNVVNKNTVIETEEEDENSLFPNAFGIPLGDDSSPDDSAAADYFESNENQEQGDSASVEGTELANYNAANAANTIQSENAESGNLYSPSSPISSAISKPGRPNKDDDDIFSFSTLVEFFRPAINALGWLASINPFAIGLFPIFLGPIAFLFAGSGLAALFSPWFLPLGREAPKVINVYRPYWHWDDTIKTWHLHSFPDNRRWTPTFRNSNEEESPVKPTLFQKLKSLILATTDILKKNNKHRTDSVGNRKNKRKKREVWSIRVK